MAGQQRKGRPSPQDIELFHRVLADVTPLRPEPEPTSKPSDGSTTPPKAEKPAKKTPKTKPAPPHKPTIKTAATPAALADHGPGRAPGLDRRSALRLKRGKTEIDGRIDLHGMTQEQARSALTGFVISGHRQDRRCLLVITGKGRRPARDETDSWSSEPGILRQRVPRWLEEPPLVGCILAYSPAQPEHGGSGALYVLLKRRRGP
ncbi:MAG: Smr/MutS family protein [Proteobacteria bacterium]|nr:Smr/MutS family protein [Pseudomonadota bacterium]